MQKSCDVSINFRFLVYQGISLQETIQILTTLNITYCEICIPWTEIKMFFFSFGFKTNYCILWYNAIPEMKKNNFPFPISLLECLCPQKYDYKNIFRQKRAAIWESAKLLLNYAASFQIWIIKKASKYCYERSLLGRRKKSLHLFMVFCVVDFYQISYIHF